MNRVDRLMGILTVLQAKKHVTAEQVAGKFEISVRTVYRDIKALCEIGVPVSFEPNKGYFIVPGYFIPPVAFTVEEANALVLMETIAGKFGDNSIKQHYESAFNKIKAVLKGPQKDQVEYLHSQIRVYKPIAEEVYPKYLTEIQNAITNKTILKIEYRNNRLEATKRAVEPIGLTFYSMSWHMIAWCWLRKEYRDFKIPHILNLVNTLSPFKKSGHHDIDKYIKSLQP